MEEVREWDRIAPIFQWSVRTTCKLFSGNFTPYEIITGLKPRTPLDALLATPSGVKVMSHDEYVRELVKYLQSVHKLVDEQHERVRTQTAEGKYRELGAGTGLRVGDHCFVKRQVVPGTSTVSYTHLTLPTICSV